MKDMNTDAKNTPYDLASITKAARNRMTKTLITVAVSFIILALSTSISMKFHSNIPIFLILTAIVLISVLTLKSALSKIKFSDFRSSSGEIVNVHKEVKTVRTTLIGGINLFGARRYDQDNKDEIRLTVVINCGSDLHYYHLVGVTEEHFNYYDNKSEVIHIPGTRYPVKPSETEDKWLCPICGTFNKTDTKLCTGCGVKAIK